jgi:hypothetical protein
VLGTFDGEWVTDVAACRPSRRAWHVMNVLTIVGLGDAAGLPALGKG